MIANLINKVLRLQDECIPQSARVIQRFLSEPRREKTGLQSF